MFLDMIGHHFDILWTYITALKKNIKVEEKQRVGISDDMLNSCCLYGTPQDVRDQVGRYDGVLDRVIFFSPRHGVEHEVNLQYYDGIFETFGNK